MNKLEELKALMAEEDKREKDWRKARLRSSDKSLIESLLADFREVRDDRRCLSDELLPHLIAVAEAAKGIDWPNACLKNYEERILVNVLLDALLSLTKDADK